MAFEIGACELLADQWEALQKEPAADLILNQVLDKAAIYRLALQETAPIGRRAAFLHLLERRYKKHYKWVEELASSRVDGAFNISSGGRLFSQFLYTLDGVAPLATAEEDKENAHLREEAERQRKKIKQLQKELEQTEKRAGSVHKRFKEQDIELQGLKRELREERENGEKLRSERKTRIKSQRQTGETQRDLDHLRREYLKLDGRLKEMASRLALSEGRSQAGQLKINLDGLRHLDLELLLGIGDAVDEKELGRVRRRFAAAFHPDRVVELPRWVSDFFLEVLGLVNEACDRAKKK